MPLGRNYLQKLESDAKKVEECENGVRKRKLQVVDSFPLPPNSSHASVGKPKNGNNSAFTVTGTVVRKAPKTMPSKATIIENSLSVFQEYMKEPAPIDVKCSIKADDMQEPRPKDDNCPEVESSCSNLTLNQSEVVPSSQPEEDAENVKKLYHSLFKKPEIVPSSQPENDPNEDDEVAELEQLVSGTPVSSGRIEIVDDSEKKSLFAPRILRSHTSHNKSLVPYDVSPFRTPVRTRQFNRSFEKQSESDFIDDSAISGKSKRSSSNRFTPSKGKVPELPADYDQLLEAMNFQTKGRKQCDEAFGKLEIKGYDLYSLRTRQYVNDLIIDNYLKLVCKRSCDDDRTYRKSYAFGTYFYTIMNNGQNLDKLVSWVKEDLFQYELLFLPINQENHWFLFVADTVNRNFFIYDSLHYGEYVSEVNQIVNFLKYYAAKKNHEIDWDDWSNLPIVEQQGPAQSNGVDCGIFLCQYAEHLSRRATLDFAQCGMVNYRKIMLYELMNGELLPKFDDNKSALKTD